MFILKNSNELNVIKIGDSLDLGPSSQVSTLCSTSQNYFKRTIFLNFGAVTKNYGVTTSWKIKAERSFN